MSFLIHGQEVTMPAGEVRHIVYVGIGRPLMQETEAGELCSVHVMSLRGAVALARDLLNHVMCVIDHMDGKEDCSDV